MTLVASMDDTTVRVWDVARRRRDTVLEGHLKPVVAIDFSGDMRLLANQDAAGVINIWRTDTWRRVSRIEDSMPAGSECLSFHPKAPILATIGKRLERGRDFITCGVCDERVTLVVVSEDETEDAASERGVAAIESSADQARDREAGLTAAVAEIETQRFETWAGGEQAEVAIVFTDIVGSTGLWEELGDEKMDDMRAAHFETGRALLVKLGGYEIKTMGDAFMVAFKSAVPAFTFMLALHDSTGHDAIHIRAAADVGLVRIRDNDAFGGTVNFAAQLQGLAADPEIWVSDKVKQSIDAADQKGHADLPWKHHLVTANETVLKGFKGAHHIWRIATASGIG